MHYIHRRLNMDQDRVQLIAFYPYPEKFHPENEVQQRLKGIAATFMIDIQIVNHPEELISLPDIPIVSIEERRDNQSVDVRLFEHPRECVYIVGNSVYEYPSDYFNVTSKVSIALPTGHPLYGDQAAAVILTDRTYKYASV